MFCLKLFMVERHKILPCICAEISANSLVELVHWNFLTNKLSPKNANLNSSWGTSGIFEVFTTIQSCALTSASSWLLPKLIYETCKFRKNHHGFDFLRKCGSHTISTSHFLTLRGTLVKTNISDLFSSKKNWEK